MKNRKNKYFNSNIPKLINQKAVNLYIKNRHTLW